MHKNHLFLAAMFFVLPLFPVSAQELRLPIEGYAAVVPAVPAASAALDPLGAECKELYSALRVYSDNALKAPQNSPEFMEASAAGQYLRGKLEQLGGCAEISDRAGAGGEQRGAVSFRVRSELNDVFGFYGAPVPRPAETRAVQVKAGYCQINYINNKVPFLVQHDGFLKKGEIILTYDDGPGPLSGEVSASVKEGGARALFFVLGRNLAGAAGKERVKAEAADGNLVGVHGYDHATVNDRPFTAYSPEKVISQLRQVAGMISGAAGQKPGFFRPPYGIISPEALKLAASELGLVPLGWTIDTLDWSTKDPETLFQNTIAMIKQRGKGIVLMHDIHPQSRAASRRLVAWLAVNGYKVVPPERLALAYKGE